MYCLKYVVYYCYYYFSVLMVNWTEAEATCQRRHVDAHLVSIDSAAKQRFLKHKWMNERGTNIFDL